MASPRRYAALLIALTIAATLFTPITNSVVDATNEQSVTNETVTAQTGTFVDLERYQLVDGSETVYNSSGVEMTRGTDYEIDYGDGRIKALSGGDISDGSEIQVSYQWRQTTGTTSTVLDLIPLFVALLILAIMASQVMEAM